MARMGKQLALLASLHQLRCSPHLSYQAVLCLLQLYLPSPQKRNARLTWWCFDGRRTLQTFCNLLRGCWSSLRAPCSTSAAAMPCQRMTSRCCQSAMVLRQTRGIRGRRRAPAMRPRLSWPGRRNGKPRFQRQPPGRLTRQELLQIACTFLKLPGHGFDTSQSPVKGSVVQHLTCHVEQGHNDTAVWVYMSTPLGPGLAQITQQAVTRSLKVSQL